MTRRIVGLSAVAGTLLMACSSATAPAASSTPVVVSPSASVSVTPSPTPASAPHLTGPCANAYLPVLPGASWTYAVGGGNAFRQTLDAITDKGFTVLRDFGDAGTRDVWSCSAAGLAEVEQYVTGPNQGPAPPGTNAFHHFHSDGVTIPSDPSAGAAWKQVVTSDAHFKVQGVQYLETRVVATSYRVAGEESVTTPAGTFRALKVQMTQSSHKASPDYGNGIDIRDVVHITQWWVRGVGIVKSESPDGAANATFELTAYRFPV